MQIALLPKQVRITLNEHHDWRDEVVDGVKKRTKGEQLPDTPTFVCRPVSSLEQAETAADVYENAPAAYAQIAVSHLKAVEGLTVDGGGFDPRNEDHIAALNGTWLIEIGMALANRTKLSDEDAGKSQSPSVSG